VVDVDIAAPPNEGAATTLGILLDPSRREQNSMRQATGPRYAALVICGLLAVFVGVLSASAQSGSAGGSIGESEKSISGTRVVPPVQATQPPTTETHMRF